MILDFLLQFVAAGLGTVAFSILFFVPAKYYPICGVIGGSGWLICLTLNRYLGLGIEVSSFAATAFVIMCSRIAATKQKCPATLFLISGIFPLVPGTGIYWTVYYMIMGEMDKCSQYGRQTLTVAIAIVLGIIFVFEIPNSLIRKICRK
ncbi:threonine/serine exporter [Lactonifactor longoviformis]|uniref:Uncharacterized membrane protein YjjB, DUF3815 family n=1 Tax=Lactonifactor longoviformis DSM 17459 TaxID=1122155 RepID=A0A1M4SN45_9CLOT|nr:threonine/serine exporter family protein [Lactonifactor longoviformis]MCB5712076.1 threonine/serine exporter family protein [Lactonifactor longoviformis]MCB5716120.1 threonine/serine exporter family protein [Lactonifactor longoviformis]POP30789.1 threonine/serine exporter [Lactonifactor longoviformis]SHE33598.1 Uncharacterized membrane protein YjjB, DUF3815 family [Lactonifactor longoviformis DSM 17459]